MTVAIAIIFAVAIVIAAIVVSIVDMSLPHGPVYRSSRLLGSVHGHKHIDAIVVDVLG